MIKRIAFFLKPVIPRSMWSNIRQYYEKIQLNNWGKSGRPIPVPHIVKQITVAGYQKKLKYALLIETGTFMGAMVEAQKRNFKRVISIELSNDLYQKATKRFKRDQNVTILQGDSGKVLKDILKEVKEPAIFWLDGHYSGGFTAKGEKECPIFEEMDAILKSSQDFEHVILIDDARCFIGQGDYPTIEELNTFINKRNERYHLEVHDDIIRFTI